MFKVFFMLICLISISNAAIVRSGSLMCNNENSIRKLVLLDRQGKANEFWNYYSLMASRRICSETVMNMNTNNLGRRDLSGGVTQIGTIFVATDDIGK